MDAVAKYSFTKICSTVFFLIACLQFVLTACVSLNVDDDATSSCCCCLCDNDVRGVACAFFNFFLFSSLSLSFCYSIFLNLQEELKAVFSLYSRALNLLRIENVNAPTFPISAHAYTTYYAYKISPRHIVWCRVGVLFWIFSWVLLFGATHMHGCFTFTTFNLNHNILLLFRFNFN